MALQYVRAVFDFSTTVYGEISLRTGDVVLLLYKVDENWVCGKLRGQVGNFPVSFVEPIVVPDTAAGEKLFYAVEDFPAVMSGDLAFNRGDVVVGMSPVDKSWHHGRHGNLYGMFPLTHVRELDTAPPGEFVKPQVDSTQVCGLKTSPLHDSTHVQDTETGKDGEAVAKGYANMDLEAQYNDELSFNKGDVISVIKIIDPDFALGECNGTIGSFPLSFIDVFEGEITSPVATETKKSKFRWWEEESSGTSVAAAVGNNGRQGDIKVSTVPDVENRHNTSTAQNALSQMTNVYKEKGEITSPVATETKKSEFCWWEENLSGTSAAAVGNDGSQGDIKVSTVPDVENRHNTSTAQNALSQMTNFCKDTTKPEIKTDEKSQKSEPISSQANIPLDESQNTPSPASLTVASVPYNKNTDLKKTHRRTGSYTLENTRSYDSSVTPYGKTMFPFVAENHNELSFFDNEIVTLIQHIDEQWIEGEIEGRTGIFPASFIEVIVDCPWPEDYKPEAEENLEDVENIETSTTQHYEGDSINTTDDKETVSTAVNISESGDQDLTVSSNANAQFGRVTHSFTPDNPSDLSFLEGDVVNILRQADEHWFEVQTSNGTFGFCPISYVEMVEDGTLVEMPAEQMNKVRDENLKEPEIVSKQSSGRSQMAMPNQNGAVVGDRKPEELDQQQEVDVVISGDVKPSKPVISAKPKPALKPKPQLQPKPDTLKLPHNNNNNPPEKSPMTTNEGVVSTNEKTGAVLYRTNSCDSYSRQSSDESLGLPRQNSEGSTMVQATSSMKSRPQRPAIPPTQRSLTQPGDGAKSPSQPPPKPPTGPVFAKTDSFATSSCLDTIIEDQMKHAKAEADSRSRSSSMLSDDASTASSSSLSSTQPPPVIPPRKCDLQKPQGSTSPRNYTSLRELQSNKNKQERKVAMSTFYVDSGVQAQEGSKSGGQTGPRSTRQVEPPKSLQGGGPNRPVPQRKAPPRPGQVGRGRSAGDLIAFSPEGEEGGIGSPDAETTENAEVVSDLDRRIREIEDDIQAYTKNKNELERFLVKHEGDSEGEKVKVRENLDFTLANIQGLTEELNQLRESLYQFRPERKALDQERESQAEQQRLLVEEQRRREEVEKLHQEEEIKRRHEKRIRVIQELVQTEKDYLRSITVCHDTFFDPNFHKHPQVELEQLFGNMEEVVDLSQRLLSALEQATQGQEFGQQKIGECFVMLKKDMTKVYAPYCRNHDDVLQLLEKYEETPEVQAYLTSGVDLIKQQMAVFDLGSVLIKPVQRVLKYPLLLNELIKNTEEDHPDKFHLLGAITCMTQVAAAINEFKRRKDLVKKYKVERKEDLGDKLARLNVHSTKKKLNRLSQKMVGTLTVDETFKGEERKFKNLESALRGLVRNVSQYMDHIQESTSSLEMVANDLSDYYAEKGSVTKIERYCQVTNHIATKLCYRFRQEVEMQVIHPLNRLLVLFVAPNKVIKKRHDKLLDYDNIRSKSNGPEVEMARKTYEALNAQLLDELPQLYRLCVDLIQDCVVRLVRTQKHFHEEGLNEMYKLLGIDLVLTAEEGALMEHFVFAHTQAVERLSDLSFVPKTFNPRVEEKKPGGKSRKSSEYKQAGSSSPVTSSRQSEGQRQQLRQQYPTDRVYSVTQGFPGGGAMELSLTQGWLVGVLKEGDPMGNKDRWFVDNGVDKGFVPKTCLTLASTHKHSSGSFSADLLSDDLFIDAQCKSPALANKNEEVFDPFESTAYSQSPVSSHLNPATNYQSDSMLQPHPANTQSGSPLQNQESRISQSEEVTVKPNKMATIPDLDADFLDDQLDEIDYYQAIYPFTARTDLEVSLTEGHYVKVVEKHDLDGNGEWWLVEIEGHRGYAPSNYIEKVT